MLFVGVTHNVPLLFDVVCRCNTQCSVAARRYHWTTICFWWRQHKVFAWDLSRRLQRYLCRI